MITYTVKYKKRNSLFYKKIKKCKGDSILENGLARVFILEDETRIEVPCTNIIFEFSKERFLLVKERMDNESGQTIPLNKR